MEASRSRWIALALISGALLAGCGGSGKSTSSNRSPAAPTSTSTSTGTSTSPGSKNVKQALEDCKRTVQKQTKLSAGARANLERACEKAARGEVSSVRRIAEEVCREVVNGSGLKPGPQKERALAACRAAGGK